MRKPVLTPQEETAITDAISRAEICFSGEIAVAIVPQSSRYALYEMHIGFFAACSTAALMILYTQPLEQFFTSLGLPALHLFSLLPLLSFSLFYAVTNIPSFERHILPKEEMRKKVVQRAQRHFLEAGVAHTPHHRGILIFISLLERRVELIADRGYNEIITSDQWDALIAPLRKSCADGSYVSGILEAIDTCQKMVSPHFPPLEETTQVLQNKPVLLAD